MSKPSKTDGVMSNFGWVALGAVLFFLYQQFESSQINELTQEDHIEGATKFQHYIENSDHEQDDEFVLQDKLSDWRQWMMQNAEPIPDEFQEGFVAPPAPVTLSPIEKSQQKLKQLEEEQQQQQQSFNPFNVAPTEPLNRPLTVAEMMAKGVAAQQTNEQPQPIAAGEEPVEEADEEVNEAKTLVESVLDNETISDAVLLEPVKDEKTVSDEAIPEESIMPKEEEAVSEEELEPEVDEEVEEDEEAQEEEEHVHIGDEAFFADDDAVEDNNEEEKETAEASSITGENIKTNKFLTEEEKRPEFIIIGATKCSTSALLRFLQFHPLLRTPTTSELYFFNKHYDKGIDWYYKQFEGVAIHNRNLTLFEKTPTYYQNPSVPERVKKAFPDIKLIISVCHPIKRLVSRYYHALAIRPDTKDVLGDFEAYQELLTDYATNATTDFEPVFADEHVDDKIQKLTDDFLLKHHTPFNHMKLSQAILMNSCYSIFLRNWLKHFDRDQIFLVNGNEIISNPGKVMLEVEEFVGVQKWYSEDNFVINPDTGYYCIKTKAQDSELHCLTGSKGRKKEELSQGTVDKLLEFYKPFNDDLKKLFPSFAHSWDESV